MALAGEVLMPMTPGGAWQTSTTGSSGRQQWETWVDNTTSIKLPGTPVPNPPQTAAHPISYEDIAEALGFMGINIPADDIYSVHMDPDGVTVEYYATPRVNAKRSRIVYPLVFERDQDVMWDWKTAV